MLENEIIEELIGIALAQRRFAYAPYSGFRVGAALLAEGVNVYTGCNIENASYSLSCCAERVAIFKAITEDSRKYQALCVAGGKEEEPEIYCPPCGACRQVLSEFCDHEFPIIIAKNRKDYKIMKLSELLPMTFEL